MSKNDKYNDYETDLMALNDRLLKDKRMTAAQVFVSEWDENFINS